MKRSRYHTCIRLQHCSASEIAVTMGVDLSQYRSAIGAFSAMASIMGPKTWVRIRRRKKEEDLLWVTENDTGITPGTTLLFMFLYFAYNTIFTVNPDLKEFVKLTCSTNITGSRILFSSIPDYSDIIRLSLGIISMIRILQVRYGVESSPGPIFRMFDESTSLC